MRRSGKVPEKGGSRIGKSRVDEEVFVLSNTCFL